MKKVIVLTIVITLLATSAWAVVRNSKHDLSSANSSGGSIVSTNYNEVCVFCHTPHGGATGGLAPLWNRSADFNVYVIGDLYNSVTLEAASAPTAVVAAVNASDAKLCMSCHDGTSLNNGLFNPANSSNNVQPIFAAGLDVVSADANLGTDLTNDHPIGMDYEEVRVTDLEFVPSSGASPNDVGGLPLYAFGTGGDVMWCSSCHDVHDDSFDPFLNVSNVGSALCTTCHIK